MVSGIGSSKYRRIVQIGRGGMAEVFLALWSGPARIRKLVVLKQMHRKFIDDPDVEAMFLDEGRIAARLNHPNVVQTYGVEEEGDLLFLTMEHLDGQPLNRIRDRIRREDGLSVAMQLRILTEVLAGLHYSHELCDHDGTPLALVHRDVSPGNIFVTYSGQVKVIDFGIAKVQDACHQTNVGVLKGKPSYMAPEQALAEAVDRRADVFAAGVILWEILTGRRLFKGERTWQEHIARLTGTLPSPRSVDPSVPPRLDAICMRALARRREDRHATAADLQRDLEEVLEPLMPQCSLRELGKLIEDKFQAERAKLQGLIRRELAAEEPAAASPLPVAAPAPLPRPARRAGRRIFAATTAAVLAAMVALFASRFASPAPAPGVSRIPR